jgi:uncharacterized phage protein gp47/JayE
MAFQIKDFASISASMINWMRSTQQKLTDFNIGSAARTMVEAPAAEIDELYQQMVIGLKEAIEVSVYNSFSFDEVTALPAIGYIRVFVTAATTAALIPDGTVFTPTAGGVKFTSNASVTIPAGATYADVLVTCDQPGVAGNIAAGVSFTIEPTLQSFASASSLTAFASGVDQETPDERKARFNDFVSSLNRGTIKALRYGLSLAFLTDANGNRTERVVSSSIIEPYLTNPSATVSRVLCYVHNGAGSTSADLVARASEVLHGYYDASGQPVPGWKSAGVKVEVFAAIEALVNVDGTLTAADGYDKPTLVTQAVQVVYSYLISRGIGEPAILSEIIKQVKEIPGVYDIVFSSPSANVTVDQTTKLMPGAITIL